MRQAVFVTIGILLLVSSARAENTCLARLDALGVRYHLLGAIEDPGACGAERPLRPLSLASVALSGPAVFTCPFLEQLAHWTREVVAPAARRNLGTEPRSLRIGTTYQCRSQNRQPGAKLSEHSYANAVDLMGFVFDDGTELDISGGRDPASPAGRFQRQVRTNSCRYFTTVLGPGADGFHQDHLHLDLRRRDGGYRICQ